MNVMCAVLAASRLYGFGDAEVGFRMELGKAEDKAPALIVRAEEMTAMSAVTNAGGRIAVEWKGHAKAGADFAVTVTFTPIAGGGLEYAFAYSGNRTGLDVEEIHFPEIELPRNERTRFLYPNQTGMVRQPKWGEPGKELFRWGPRFTGSHFAAILDEEGTSWYFDMRGDARNHPNWWICRTGEKPMTGRYAGVTEMACLPETRERGSLPYGGIIRPFRGGWYAATEIYRAWVRQQSWYKEAVAQRRHHLRDIGLWLWNRGHSSVVTGVIDRVARDTGAKIALDWYWWHDNPYGGAGPYYWPPREGVDSFGKTVSALKARGIYVQNYINGMCCDVDDPRWNDGDWAETRLERDGSYALETYNPFLHHRSAWMCGKAPVFQGRIAFLSRSLAEAGVDGVYIDQVAHGANTACWSAKHAHPRGGGTHAVDGNREMMRRIRAENPRTDFSSEEETEAYLDVFDSLIVLYGDYETMGRGVGPEIECPPIFEALYHPAVTMYGSMATIDLNPPWDEKWPEECRRKDEPDLIEKYPDEFAVNLARPVVYGIQPCAHHLLATHPDDPRTAADYRFLVDTVRFYVANRDLLYDGDLRDPGTLTCATKTVRFLIRGCYAKNGVYRELTQPALPTVIHAVWRAPSGETAAVLVNWTKAPQRYRLTTPDLGTVEGELAPRSWKRIGR